MKWFWGLIPKNAQRVLIVLGIVTVALALRPQISNFAGQLDLDGEQIQDGVADTVVTTFDVGINLGTGIFGVYEKIADKMND